MKSLIFFFVSLNIFAQGWHDNTNTHLDTNASGALGASGATWGPGGTSLGCPINNYQLGYVQNGVTQSAFAYADNCHYIIGAQSGGALDTKRNRLYVFGGGHASTIDNSVYYYDFSTSPPVVVRVTAPSVVNIATCTNPQPSDGLPVSRHSYDSMVYMPTVDAFLITGGVNYCGNGLTDAWKFSPATATWTQLPSPFNGPPFPTNGPSCVWNSTRAKVDCMYGSYLTWTEYDPIANGWTQLGGSNAFCNGVANCGQTVALTLGYDPVRQLIIGFGGSTNAIGSNFTQIVTATDFSVGSNYATQDWQAQLSSGCAVIATASVSGSNVAQYPGFTYDPANDDFAVYPGTGNTIYSFNPTTKQCSVISGGLTGGPPNTAKMSVEGTYGRFRYSQATGQYYVVLGVDQDIFSFTRDANPTFGLASSTLACKDRDGDGYGVGTLKVSISDLAIDATTNTLVSSISYTFLSTDVGRYLVITTGSGGWIIGTYQVVSVVGGKATLARSPGATSSTGGVAIMDGCLGTDSDDLDASVHTGAQVITKWGSLTGWMNHKGYVPGRIWYMAPGSATPGCNASLGACVGNDSTGGVNDINHPYLTYAAIVSAGELPGDVFILRDGTYSQSFSFWTYDQPLTAISGKPYFLIGFPGERPIIANHNISSVNAPYIVMDGFDMSIASIEMSTLEGSASTTSFNIAGNTVQGNSLHKLVRNINAQYSNDGDGAIVGFSGMVDVHISDSVIHDQGAQHNIYMGSHFYPSGMISLRRSILYNANLNNFHWNGRVWGLVTDQNLMYNAGIANISWQQGVSKSFARSNILINPNSEAFDIDDYPGSQLAGLSSTCTAGNPGCDCGPLNNQVCKCPTTGATGSFWNGPHISGGSSGSEEICPYSQVSDTFENNTVYLTGTGACGNATCTISTPQPNRAVYFSFNQSNSDSTNPTPISLGSHIFRNNILVNYGNNNVAAQLNFSDVGSTGCGAMCASWVSSSTFDHNVYYHADGLGNTSSSVVLALGSTTYTSTTATTPAPNWVTATNTIGNPQFSSASINYWASPNLFNFHIPIASIASHAGNSTFYPVFDEIGVPFGSPPSIGALETSLLPLITTTSPLPPGVLNSPYSTTLIATNGPITWALTSGTLPTGLSLALSTGVISGTPTVGGTSTFQITATNSVGSSSVFFNLTIGNPPTITTPSPLPSGTISVAYSTALSATGDTPITWSLTSGTLPNGLSLSSGGVISGTPGVATTSTFGVTATNSVGSNAKTFSLTINNAPPTPPAITTSSPLPGGTQNVPYSTTIAVTGTSPITCAVTSGSLPTGLSLGSSSCILGGIPSGSGTSTFTITATNAAGSNPKTFSLTITAAVVPPNITTLSPLPSGIINTPYSITLQATGTSPITWALVSGTLPTGFSLNTSTGAITGTTAIGNVYSFTISATNAAGSTNQAFNLTISASSGVTINGIVTLSGSTVVK
jgi:hypothetical protein